MGMDKERMEFERMRTMGRTFGWESVNERVNDKEIEITMKKKREVNEKEETVELKKG